MTDIFAKYAPDYWCAGLSALPLVKSQKRPSVLKWQSYENSLPNEKTKEDWIEKLAGNGIGINTGTKLNDGTELIALDCDDEVFVPFVEIIVGNPVCGKRGKKGKTIFARMKSSAKSYTTTFIGKNGLGNIDILHHKRQTVLPPTIHPDTNEPYTWEGPSLLEIGCNNLPLIDERQLRVLKVTVESEFLVPITTGRATNEPSCKLVAQLVKSGATDEEIKLIITSVLPREYSGNTLSELNAMISGAREKGFDQPKMEGDPKQSEVILEYLQSQNFNLFKSPMGEGYITFKGRGGGFENYPVRSTNCKNRLNKFYYDAIGKPPASAAVKEAIDHLDAMARIEGKTETTFIRVAKYKGLIYVDLADAQNRAVKITPKEWIITQDVPVKFVRPNGTIKALPLPEVGFAPETLRELFGMDMKNFVLLIAFCINALNPDGPYLALQIHGQQGSGKSIIGQTIKGFLDPNVGDKLRLPKGEQDVVLHAQAHWVLNYENASYVPNDLSDLLCTLSTGGAFSQRKLYTDDEQKTYIFKRPFIINGIGNYANRPDLQERSIVMNLSSINPEDRKTERELRRELDKMHAGVLGYLFNCVCHALANIDEVEPPRNFRMADAAHWLLAAEGATGFPEGAILDALENVQKNLMAQTAINDVLTATLLQTIAALPNHRFEGLVSSLHEMLRSQELRYTRSFPASPSALSTKLKRMQHSLKLIGVDIQDAPRTSGGQPIIIVLNEDAMALTNHLEQHSKGDGHVDF